MVTFPNLFHASLLFIPYRKNIHQINGWKRLESVDKAFPMLYNGFESEYLTREQKMHTFSYKCGYIHDNFTANITRVQVDRYAYPIQVPSVHAAKILITKHLKSGRAMVPTKGAK